MRLFFTLILFSALLAACGPAVLITPEPAALTPVPATETPSLCLPCGSQKATMTARVPATQTMAAMQATQTAIAPTVRATLNASITATPSEACGADQAVCILSGHFLFQRPIGLGQNQSVDKTYRYGTTQDAMRESHHGVEFPNAQGTPVLAAADGVVVFAGADDREILAWVPNFYGNVVVVMHTLDGARFFTLYGHLYKVSVKPGVKVKAGQQIGEVGATGGAIGSHLHFEVRQGQNSYRATRNPELWLSPLPGMGVLAGKITDAAGNPLRGKINLQRVEDGQLNPLSVAAAETYTIDTQPVNSDDTWGETFSIGELPAGQYRISLVAGAKVYEEIVRIEPGKLTLVRLVVK